MQSIKDALYNRYVRRDPRIQYEYERYVKEHIEEHRLNRVRHWRLLFKLNKYYSRNNAGPYLYFDNPHIFKSLSSCEKYEIGFSPNLSNDSTNVKAQKNNGSIILHNKTVEFMKKYQSPYFFMKSLMSYDVISFDVFDTLVFRPLLNPYDLFVMLQKTQNIFGFEKIRRKAANQAVELSKVLRGSSEISLSDIYTEVEKLTGLSASEGQINEFEMELDLCYPNPFLLETFKLLKAQGKKVIAVSDMYFSKSEISAILKKCGYFGLDEIFVSSEYNTGKSGGLFKIVKERYATSKIIHIGDNEEKDRLSANENGLDSILYPNVNSCGIASGKGMSALIRSAYEGLVNAYLLNGTVKESPQYEYGFMYGGLCTFGYCNWIEKKAKSISADKVVFVSRDGFILNKVYKDVLGNKNSEYAYWSRMAGLMLAPEFDKNTFIQDTIRRRKNDKNSCNIGKWLEIMGLEFLASELSKYSLHETDPIIKENSIVFENLVSDNWSKVVEKYTSKGIAAREYWKKIVGDSKSILLVDIGWQGQSMALLKWLINTKWDIKCNVSIALFGSCCSGNTENLTSVIDGTIDTYAFSQFYNNECYDFFKNSNKGRVKSIFELFYQAPHPSLKSFEFEDDQTIKYMFGVPEVENYSYIKDIHKGIFDFCQLYFDSFKNYSYMYNISGYDSLVPFMKLTSNKKEVKKLIGDMIFPLDTFCNDNELLSYKVSNII